MKLSFIKMKKLLTYKGRVEGHTKRYLLESSFLKHGRDNLIKDYPYTRTCFTVHHQLLFDFALLNRF